ncbi:MAG: hypothetical protein ACRD3N_04605 [Terracidiphilus sp.]
MEEVLKPVLKPVLKCVLPAAAIAAMALAANAATRPAQDASGPVQYASGPAARETFEADYSNPELSPSHWILTIHPDGDGHFRSWGGKGMGADGSDIRAEGVDRDIQVSKEFAAHVFEVAHREKLFKIGCESHLKVAFQGLKTLRYSGPDGAGSCTFNYSKDKEIEDLGDSMLGVEGTIMEGARLELLLKHDPLGLDQEMTDLVEAAKDGRAQQLCAIRGILTQIVNDPDVLIRVREWAGRLLADGKS